MNFSEFCQVKHSEDAKVHVEFHPITTDIILFLSIAQNETKRIMIDLNLETQLASYRLSSLSSVSSIPSFLIS